MKDEKGSFFDKFFRMLKSNDSDNSNQYKKKPPIMLVIAAIALVVLLLINTLTPRQDNDASTVFNQTEENSTETFGKSKNTIKTTNEFEEQYENDLKDALEQIAGVGTVSVVVNVEGSEKQIVEKNTATTHSNTDETDKEGGKRTIEEQKLDEKVVIVKEDNQEKPIVVSIEKPKIKGVLVVAKGVDKISIKKEVVEAVTRVLDVPSHRVSVQARK